MNNLLTIGAVAATLLSLNPSAKALQDSPNKIGISSTKIVNAIETASASNQTLLAQASRCPNYNPSEFVRAETKNFVVYICGGDLPHTYIGVAKNGRGNITLPLQSVSRNRFVAVNGNHRYTLTRDRLVVTRNGRTIVNESARWIF